MENLNLNLEKFIKYLKENDQKFQKVAVQISDNLLQNTISLIKLLQKEFPLKFFFTVAETSYGACCADEVAAQHLKADLILRVGRSCLTQTQNIPVYFMNVQKSVDSEKLAKVLLEIEVDKVNQGEYLVSLNHNMLGYVRR